MQDVHPITRLDHLFIDKIPLEEHYLFPLPIKESEIQIVLLVISQGCDFTAHNRIQTNLYQPADRFKVFVTIGHYNSHVGEGVQGSREVATTI